MARIRYLKPEFFTDEDLCSLPYQTRLAFEGLWCYADKAGRLEDRPKFLKISIFPYDNVDMEKQLDSLTCPKPFINRYKVEGKRYIQIVNWEKHQRPHHTERESFFPPAPPINTMEKGMGMGSVHDGSAELRNGELTVKTPLNVEQKETFGEFKNVLLKKSEFTKLAERFEVDIINSAIEEFGSWMKANGKNKKDHYAALLNWVKEKRRREAKEQKFL